MFVRNKKFYTLDDIKKQIVFTPPLFIILVTVIAIFLLYANFNLQQKNEIQKLNQEQILSNSKVLQDYITTLNQTTNTRLDNIEINLSNFTYEIKGLVNNNEKIYADDYFNLKEYLKEIEQNQDITFLVFDTYDYNVIYGKDLIEQLRLLTNSQIKSTQFTSHMLKNIEYIADKNLIYWIDNKKRKIQLSYFLKVKEYYIGAFSKIDDMKIITKQTILKLINEEYIKLKDAHIFFYDKSSEYTFNYYDQQKYSTISFNNINKYINKNLLYEIPKYDFVIGIKNEKLNKEIEKIKIDYEKKFLISLFIAIFIASVLIISSNLFGKFLSTIFQRYNQRIERKNYLFKKWKERYELAIIASNDGLWDLDLTTNKIFFSKKWLDMYGYERGDIKSFDDWLELVHPDEKELVQRKFKEHLEGLSEHLICEYRLKAKDKKYKWVLIRGKAFIGENSKRVLLMSMNIDERMNLIKDLKNVELLTDFGRIVIFRWNNNDNLDVKFVSKSIESYGYEVDDFMTKKISYLDFVYKEDRKNLLINIKNAIKQNKESFTNIFRVLDANKKTKWVYNRNIIIKDDYGNVVELYGYINDITKMKLQEEELKKQIKEELDKNLYKDRLLIQQNKLASMGEMLGNIAHQWRQPLNNVNLLIHLIRDNHMNFSEEKLNKLIKNAKEQIDFMSQTIDDFTDFYKPAKDKKIFNIKNVVEKSLSIVNAPLQKNNINLKINYMDIELENYENEFEQVVVNIINNAIDAAKIKKAKEDFEPYIKIDIKKENNQAVLSMFNNCGNIPTDIIERVFEPYFTTKFQDQGTGIGLYMSKIIIENNMNGHIEVQNIDDGVEFIIKLPI